MPVAIVLAGSMAAAARPGSSAAASLTVEVVGAHRGAPVYLALFAEKDQWLEDGGAVRKSVQPGPATADAAVRWLVDELPRGIYAARAFQDLNGNGRLDKNRIGLPTEPFGFSNDAKPRLGPPGWWRVKFEHESSGDVTPTVRFSLRGGPKEAEEIARAYERKHGKVNQTESGGDPDQP